MRRGLAWMALGCVLAIAGFHTWMHRLQIAESVAAPQGPVAHVYTESSESAETRGMVTITGPLADYMSRRNTEPMRTPQPSDSKSPSSTSSYKPTQMDLVDDSSPVGTSTPILHKTFEVAALVNLPFDIPPPRPIRNCTGHIARSCRRVGWQWMKPQRTWNFSC